MGMCAAAVAPTPAVFARGAGGGGGGGHEHAPCNAAGGAQITAIAAMVDHTSTHLAEEVDFVCLRLGELDKLAPRANGAHPPLRARRLRRRVRRAPTLLHRLARAHRSGERLALLAQVLVLLPLQLGLLHDVVVLALQLRQLLPERRLDVLKLLLQLRSLLFVWILLLPPALFRRRADEVLQRLRDAENLEVCLEQLEVALLLLLVPVRAGARREGIGE